MNLNATLIAQMVVFLVLAWFTMKFVWPPLIEALDTRAKKIADGLAAAELGQTELKVAGQRAEKEIASARQEGQQRIADAEKRAQVVAEEVRQKAQAEAQRIIAQAKMEAEQQFLKARAVLQDQVAVLAVKGAEQILKREIDSNVHAALLDQLKAKL